MCVLHPTETTGGGNFADRFLEMLDGGALALMVSIGHRVGMFDAMAEMPSSSSHEIAAAAGLDERYLQNCDHIVRPKDGAEEAAA